MFGSLDAAGRLAGARVLDLYAGSGAVGLEAVSRGAAYALLVESHPATARLIVQNITALGAGDRVDVSTATLPQALRGDAGEPFDVVFADPPYTVDNAGIGTVLAALTDGGWVAADADVIVERPRRAGEPPWPDGLAAVRSRRYGESILWYGRALWT